MKLRMMIAGFATLLLAGPSFAAVVTYHVVGDQSTEFPTDGTILRPGTTTGKAVIDDGGGGGSVTLNSLSLLNRFVDIVGATTSSGVPGATVTLNSRTVAGPSGGQTGTGTTSTSISWGSLSGWTQTGRLKCVTKCPGGSCGAASGCVPFVGFEGTGPPAPLSGTAFTNDPWTFTGGSYSTASIQMVNLTGGAVTANLTWGGGQLLGAVPAIPLVALGGLGAGLLYLGSRALRRKND